MRRRFPARRFRDRIVPTPSPSFGTAGPYARPARDVRDSLTVLAILLIAVLTTALVGPYLVDWNAHRAEIEVRLSALAGAPVTIHGPIDLKLLPKPVFHLGSVAIGGKGGPYGAMPGGPSLAADELDAEMSLPALLRGQIEVVDATLLAPHLDVAQGADGAIVLPRLSSGDADRVAIEHLGVRNGAVAVRLADGRRLTLQGIDLDGEATTLRGPFKAHGDIGGIPVRLATGALDGGRMRLRLDIDPAEGRPALDLDGTLALTDGPFAFEGGLAASGAIALRDTPATIPWRASAQARADAAGAALTDVEIRAGNDLRALIVDGTGTIARGAATDAVPEIAMKLHGAGLDLDGLAVAPKDSAIAPPQGSALLGLLMQAAGERAEDADLPARLALDTDFDTVTLAGRTLLGATLRLGLGRQAGATVALSTTGPDGARLALDGRIAPGPAFRGRADGAASDLPRLAAWLKPISPDLAAWLSSAVPARAVAAAGDLDASASRIAMRGATLRLDGSRFAGSLAYDRASDTARPRFVADLATDRLDLDGAPDIGRLTAPGTDLDLALAAPIVQLSGAAAGGATFPVAGGPLALHLTRSGDDLDLDRFSITLGGAAIEATASRTGAQAHAEARIEAPALAPIAAILARVAPGPVTTAIMGRAAALSPVSGTLHADATAATGGVLVPTRLTLAGMVAGTHLTATLRPDGDGADIASRPVALMLDASSPDAAVPLRALGLGVADGAIGPGEAHATANGSLAAGFAVAAKASLGGTALTYVGRVETERAHGRLTLSAPDLRPLLADVGIVPAAKDGDARPADADGDLDWSGARVAFGGIVAHVDGGAATGDLAFGPAPSGTAGSRLSGHVAFDRLPASALVALGFGAPTAVADPVPRPADAWSSAAYGPAPALPQGEVKLAIGRLPLIEGLEARDASLTLRVTRTGLALADGSARLAGGSIEGGVDLQRDGPSATLSGHVAWHDLGIDLGDLSGRAGGDLHLAGSGASPAVLVRSLGGTGTLGVAAATLARLDPEAPARTVAAFTTEDPLADPNPKGLDPAAIAKRLSNELDRSPLKLGRQSLPVVVAGGVLSVAGLKPAAGGSSVTDGSLDLGALAVSLETRFDPAQAAGAAEQGASAGQSEVVVTETGPVAGPFDRRIDAAGLVGRLQAAAVARAQERIDVIEQDIRERAYFNRQLKAIQADQAAARQQAIADAAAAKVAAALEQADEARIQAQFESAARAEAAKIEAAKAEAAKAEAEKRHFFDKEMQGLDGSDPGAAAPADRRRRVSPHEPLDLVPPPSIIEETPRASGKP